MQLTIQTPTVDLNQSIVFYKKLGFEIQTQGNKIVAIDSQICIEINPKRTA
jgi:predicted lactoylglutathione lyase